MALEAPQDAVVSHFHHDDPFVDDQLPLTDALVERYTSMGFHGDPRIDLQRVRRGRIDFTNPATQALCTEFPTVREWLELVPTAAALDPLYAPAGHVLPNGRPIDDSLEHFFRNLADARGIRSRAAVLHQVAVQQAASLPHRSRWLSLACGAAHPVLEAAAQVRTLGGPTPQATLVDADPHALALARRYARELAPTADVQLRRMNVLDLRGLHRKQPLCPRPGLRAASYDLVEAIGLLEYLRPDDWLYRYNRVVEQRRVMAGARTFLSNAWRLVAPGGLLVVGNMLTTHPQLGFTLNVVQWPHIQPRDVSSMLQLLDEAHVVGKRQVFLPDDGVYALYVVRKPS